jgi:hypothetical protein
VALIVTVAGLVWTAVLVFFGGFDLAVGRFTVTSHAPFRPFLFATLAFAAFLWANGVAASLEAGRRVVSRVDVRVAAAVLAVSATFTAWHHGTTAGFGADSYGYVSQADLWLAGDLVIEEPWAEAAPWPRAAWTFAPLGYRPPVGDENRAELVPTYAPGLPMVLALFKAVGGHCAMFLAVPLSAGLLVWSTFALGRQLGSAAAGLIGAWLVATSPAMVLAAMRPMTDVPVAACWTLAFVLAFGRWRPAPFFAGLLAGLAILIRPNLVLLAAVPGAWFVLRKQGAAPGIAGRVVALSAYVAGLAPGIVTTCVVFDMLYGSPFVSGYGRLEDQFAWANVLPNMQRYATWLIETQTVVALAGVAAVAFPVRRLWPGVRDRRVFWVIGAFAAVLWIQYWFYIVFDDWGFLRFLLPFWPLMFIGLGAVAVVAFGDHRPLFVLVAVWLVLALGIRGRAMIVERGLLNLWAGDSVSVGAALGVRAVTAPNSVVLTWLHSGSLRHYSGRITMRYDILDHEWLDRAVSWFAARGIQVYALLDEASIDRYDSEVEYFAERFAGQATAGRLKAGPVYTYGGPRPVHLFALSTPAPPSAGEPDPSIDDPAHLHCVPPVPRGALPLK